MEESNIYLSIFFLWSIVSTYHAIVMIMAMNPSEPIKLLPHMTKEKKQN